MAAGPFDPDLARAVGAGTASRFSCDSSRDTFHSACSSARNTAACESLLDVVGAAPSQYLYVSVACEGFVIADAIAPEWEIIAAAQRSRFASQLAKMPEGEFVWQDFAGGAKRSSLGELSAAVGGAARRMSTGRPSLARPLPPSLRACTLRQHGHTFSLIALPSLEIELCRRLCDDACARFEAALRAQQPTVWAGVQQRAAQSAAAPPGSGRRFSLGRFGKQKQPAPAGVDEPFVDLFSGELEQLLGLHASPERLARYRRVAEIQSAVDDAADVANENIGRMLSNRENLDVLEDKSTWMLSQTQTFRRNARSVRRIKCWQDLKLTIALTVMLTAALGAAAVYVLCATGVSCLWINLTRADGPPP